MSTYVISNLTVDSNRRRQYTENLASKANNVLDNGNVWDVCDALHSDGLRYEFKKKQGCNLHAMMRLLIIVDLNEDT